METTARTRNTSPRDADAQVGKRAHQLMWERKLTQTAVGKELGIDSGSLGKKLRGERGWSLDEVVALARVLEVTIAYLFGEENEKTPPMSGGRKMNSQPLDYKAAHSAEILMFPKKDTLRKDSTTDLTVLSS